MWLVFALASAGFAGATSILVKLGIRHTDSDVATLIRTAVVCVLAWLIVLMSGTSAQIPSISARTWTFLILSGIATGASWLCYFRALSLADVSKVAPIDKLSVVLTMVLAIIIFGEALSLLALIGILGIGLGSYLMSGPRRATSSRSTSTKQCGWLVYALLSAVFASLTAVLGKAGIVGVDSNLGTAIRCVVVLAMAGLVVWTRHKTSELREIRKNELGWVISSGIATGASWLCYFRALQEGPASVVVPIDKLSVVVTIAFSVTVLHEQLSHRSLAGMCFLVAGTLCMVFALHRASLTPSGRSCR